LNAALRSKWAAGQASYDDLKWFARLGEDRQNGARGGTYEEMAADREQWEDLLPQLVAQVPGYDLVEYFGGFEVGVLDLWSRIEREVEK